MNQAIFGLLEISFSYVEESKAFLKEKQSRRAYARMCTALELSLYAAQMATDTILIGTNTTEKLPHLQLDTRAQLTGLKFSEDDLDFLNWLSQGYRLFMEAKNNQANNEEGKAIPSALAKAVEMHLMIAEQIFTRIKAGHDKLNYLLNHKS